MKISIFTSNQTRHTSLIETIAGIADEVFAVQECNTVFPGNVMDFFSKSATMQEYFGHVMESEKNIFGDVRYLPSKVRSLPIKMGDLNRLSLSAFEDALDSDYFIVFGASFIKGELIEELVKRRAINIHMGVSPHYRGSSCNFWAADDGNFDLVGSTVHLLSKGLDSGPILFHAMPKAEEVSAFDLGMKAVRAAHLGLAEAIKSGDIGKYDSISQDKTQEIKYTRNSQFNDSVARKYLDKKISPQEICEKIANRDPSRFVNLKVF